MRGARCAVNYTSSRASTSTSQPLLLIGWSGVVHHVAERWRGEHLDAWRLPVILLALLLRKEQAEQLELGLARARLRQHGQGEVAAAGCVVVLSHKDALDRSDGGAAQHVVRVDDSIAAAGTAAGRLVRC